MGNITDTFAVCHCEQRNCEVRQPCTCDQQSLDPGSYVWIRDEWIYKQLSVQIEVRSITVSTGCLLFAEDGTFISSVNQDISEFSDCIEAQAGSNSAYTLRLYRVPPQAHFLFFVVLPQRGTFIESHGSCITVVVPKIDGTQRGKLQSESVIPEETICRFQKTHLGDGNAMVMLALIRTNDPKWRVEAVGKVYHHFGGMFPLDALGVHLENMSISNGPIIPGGNSTSFPVSANPKLPDALRPAHSHVRHSYDCAVFQEGDQYMDICHHLSEQDAVINSFAGEGRIGGLHSTPVRAHFAGQASI